MNEEALRDFADQLGVDPEVVLERWEGRPDLIIEDIFRVRDIDTGEVRDLELFDVQRRVVFAYFYGDAGTLNLYKGRRIGYSFIVIACFLLEAIFYPESFYPIAANSKSQAKDRISDIQNLIDHAKVDIPAPVTNKDEIELWNGSGFKAYSSDSDTSRGADSARAVLLDEMAFMEDQMRAYRAFGAFLALGQNRKMVEISTPNTKGDLFMQEHKRGSPDGEDGVIAVKQPSFNNAEEIDVHTSLYDQEVHPVRPDFNIDHAETQRLSDPEGFGQEYLCRPVVDEYRFFDPETVEKAMERGADQELGHSAPKRGARRIMGIDIGIDRDDTVISVMDHDEHRRIQRLLDVVDEETLREAGVSRPDPGNANHVAQLIGKIHSAMGVDAVILDKGGVGQTFERIIEAELGRGVVGFDFSDVEAVNDMFGDTNVCLRQNDMALVPDARLQDEMESIVKQKKEDYSRPRYSGKDDSESGKDDTAMATVLSAFPPKISEPPSTRPARGKWTSDEPHRPAKKEEPEVPVGANFGATRVSRSSRSRSNRYQSRRTRV